ncbi:MAG: glucose-6-phosphate dehydrogenase assembly protein OpcA [bacterium]|nr:glucose-6-phosphate dehydrogenase assembly protein OpcA [bacterium]
MSAEDLPGRIVAPGNVASELLKFWRETADHDRSARSSDSPRLKTTLANIIVFAGCEESSACSKWLQDLLTELCLSYPSRFVVVVSSRDSGEQLTCSVNSRCVLSDNGQHVCSEEIYLRVPVGARKHLKHMLWSLLVPDIEVIMIALPGFLGYEELEALQETISPLADLAGRIIYDSACVPAAATLWSVGTEEPLHLYDTSWVRLLGLRNLVREQFDSPLAKDLIMGLECVEISYSARSSGLLPPNKVFLLAGWILSCLGRDPEGVSFADGEYKWTDGFTIRLISVEGGSSARSVQQVLFKGHHPVHSYLMSLKISSEDAEKGFAYNVACENLDSKEILFSGRSFQEEPMLLREIITCVQDDNTYSSYRAADLLAMQLADFYI